MSEPTIIIDEFTGIDLEQFPDRPPYNKISEDVLKVLAQSDQAAYVVYLNLAKRFSGC